MAHSSQPKFEDLDIAVHIQVDVLQCLIISERLHSIVIVYYGHQDDVHEVSYSAVERLYISM